MIQIRSNQVIKYTVTFKEQKKTNSSKEWLLIGVDHPTGNHIQIKEACAKAIKEIEKEGMKACTMDLSFWIERFGISCIPDIIEGIVLGGYKQPKFPATARQEIQIDLIGIGEKYMEDATKLLEYSLHISKGVTFARDMVNLPGNKLRPLDFAKAIEDFLADTSIEVERIDYEQLQQYHMNALVEVGSSSAYPPCLLILRYNKNPEDRSVQGLIGKGVTCDTGGYCLKPANSMMGIKGDMAGGAAVVGAMYALAKNEIKTNVVGVIPMCENRISPGSLLPGDVISSYSGKTIEIGNTDAEGRLILADAVSYAIRKEHVSRVLDIATLTGAVTNLFGFTIGGVIADHEELFEEFQRAYQASGERYWRIPFYEEHERMIESNIADIKNVGENCCGTITAGLFIREFAEEKPWIHLDIAGTAWVDTPIFEFQSKGATGAGVTTMYYLCCKEES